MTTMNRHNTLSQIITGEVDISRLSPTEQIVATDKPIDPDNPADTRRLAETLAWNRQYDQEFFDSIYHRLVVEGAVFKEGYGTAVVPRSYLKSPETANENLTVVGRVYPFATVDGPDIYIPGRPVETVKRAA